MNRHATSLLLIMVSTSLSAAEPPAAVLDLAAWKLTLPYNSERKGDPDEVLQPELATFQDPSCFFTSESGDAVIFRASCGGLGTENSNYPRSELREMETDGEDEIGWSTSDANTHVMEIEQAITHTPDVKQHVVCAQIHDKNDDVMMVRLEKKKLFVERNKLDDVPLDSNYQLGDKFKLRIVVASGRIKVWYNEELKMDWEVSKKQCYFKAGCYTQSNANQGDRPEAFGEVAIFRLKVTHRTEDPLDGFRLWADSTGKFSVEAEFVSLEEGTVKLKRKDDQREVLLPLTRLSEDDQVFIKSSAALSN